MNDEVRSDIGEACMVDIEGNRNGNMRKGKEVEEKKSKDS